MDGRRVLHLQPLSCALRAWHVVLPWLWPGLGCRLPRVIHILRPRVRGPVTLAGHHQLSQQQWCPRSVRLGANRDVFWLEGCGSRIPIYMIVYNQGGKNRACVGNPVGCLAYTVKVGPIPRAKLQGTRHRQSPLTLDRRRRYHSGR